MKSAPREPPEETEKDGSPVARRGFRDMIRGFMLKNDPAGSKTKGSENGNIQDPKAEPKGAGNVSRHLQYFASRDCLVDNVFANS